MCLHLNLVYGMIKRGKCFQRFLVSRHHFLSVQHTDLGVTYLTTNIMDGVEGNIAVFWPEVTVTDERLCGTMMLCFLPVLRLTLGYHVP